MPSRCMSCCKMIRPRSCPVRAIAARDLATAGRPPLTLEIQAPSVTGPMLPTWASPYLLFGLSGGRPAVIITAPVTPNAPNLPAVPLSSAAWDLISACTHFEEVEMSFWSWIVECIDTLIATLADLDDEGGK